MDLLMMDFKTAVDDVASIGVSSAPPLDPATGGLSRPPPPPGHNRRSARGTMSSAEVCTAATGGGGGWTVMQRRIGDISSRWAIARRDAKAAVVACVAVHPSSTPYLRRAEGGAAATKKAFRLSEGMSRIEETSSRHVTAAEEGDVQFVPLSALWAGGVNSSHVVPHPPHGHEKYADGGAGGEGIELHLARVHVLQRDLVQFSKKAFELTHSWQRCGSSNETCDAHADSRPASARTTYSECEGEGSARSHMAGVRATFQAEVALADLRMTARQLLLHCSSWSPLAPLTPRSESPSGLERFVKEVRDEIETCVEDVV